MSEIYDNPPQTSMKMETHEEENNEDIPRYLLGIEMKKEEMDTNSNYCCEEDIEDTLSRSSSTFSYEDFEGEGISISSIRTLFHGGCPDFTLTECGHLAMAKALELFISKMAADIAQVSKESDITYDDVVKYVHASKHTSVSLLIDIFPERMSFSEVKHRIFYDTDSDSSS